MLALTGLMIGFKPEGRRTLVGPLVAPAATRVERGMEAIGGEAI